MPAYPICTIDISLIASKLVAWGNAVTRYGGTRLIRIRYNAGVHTRHATIPGWSASAVGSNTADWFALIPGAAGWLRPLILAFVLSGQGRAIAYLRATTLNNLGVGSPFAASVLLQVDHRLALLEPAGRYDLLVLPSAVLPFSIGACLNCLALAIDIANGIVDITGPALILIVSQFSVLRDGAYLMCLLTADVIPFGYGTAVVNHVLQLQGGSHQQPRHENSLH